mmetsp:Transcript_17527/g.35371  ORF Transcript_17527/g.35371 Transcript_17527/m.35371 type:complete len:343 (+) Transcript_17527:649-1677(+)
MVDVTATIPFAILEVIGRNADAIQGFVERVANLAVRQSPVRHYFQPIANATEESGILQSMSDRPKHIFPLTHAVRLHAAFFQLGSHLVKHLEFLDRRFMYLHIGAICVAGFTHTSAELFRVLQKLRFVNLLPFLTVLTLDPIKHLICVCLGHAVTFGPRSTTIIIFVEVISLLVISAAAAAAPSPPIPSFVFPTLPSALLLLEELLTLLGLHKIRVRCTEFRQLSLVSLLVFSSHFLERLLLLLGGCLPHLRLPPHQLSDFCLSRVFLLNDIQNALVHGEEQVRAFRFERPHFLLLVPSPTFTLAGSLLASSLWLPFFVIFLLCGFLLLSFLFNAVSYFIGN